MYLLWDDKFKREKPYQIVSENIPELDHLARSNIQMVEGPEELIEDIRGREESFTLDNHGFQILKNRFSTIDYQISEEVETIYQHEVESLLKDSIAGSNKIVFFNWRVRLPKQTQQRPTILTLKWVSAPTQCGTRQPCQSQRSSSPSRTSP